MRVQTMLWLTFLVVVSSGAVDGLARIKLELRHNHKQLTDLVNLLQQSHASLLEKSHYEFLEHLDGRFKISMVETSHHELPTTTHHHIQKKLHGQTKNHKLHPPHHQKQQKAVTKHQNHIATKHSVIIHDNEALMDLIPTELNKDQGDTLLPADKAIEDGLEGDTQLFFKELFNSNVISKEDMAKVDKVRGKVPLENVGNTMFIGPLKVGTDEGANVFNVIFDTGSALTCITSKLCHDIGCTRSKQYDRKKSATFGEIGKEVEITFGSGTLKGYINRERIQVNGMNLNDAVFIEITQQIGDAFHEGDFDGIVGLGYPHMTGVPTLFDYMIKQHKLQRNQFTFHLNRQVGDSGSTLIFGGVDDSLISGEWVWHDVNQKFYWSISAQQILVGDVDTGICTNASPCRMVIDTGTTLLTGPPRDVRKLLSMIPVSKNCQNFYEMPSITMIMNGVSYTLDAEDYVLTITNNGVEPPYEHSPVEDIVSCAGTLFPMDISPPQGPLWILGDIFISKYASSFDRDSDQVGLGLSSWYVNRKQQKL